MFFGVHFKKRLLPWKIHGYASSRSRSFLEFPSTIELLRVCSYQRQNELIPVWNFKPAWKIGCSHEVSFRLHFKTTRYFDGHVGISFRVVFTWYFITQKEISFPSKWTIWNHLRTMMKSIPFWFYFASIHVNTSK